MRHPVLKRLTVFCLTLCLLAAGLLIPGIRHFPGARQYQHHSLYP